MPRYGLRSSDPIWSDDLTDSHSKHKQYPWQISPPHSRTTHNPTEAPEEMAGYAGDAGFEGVGVMRTTYNPPAKFRAGSASSPSASYPARHRVPVRGTGSPDGLISTSSSTRIFTSSSSSAAVCSSSPPPPPASEGYYSDTSSDTDSEYQDDGSAISLKGAYPEGDARHSILEAVRFNPTTTKPDEEEHHPHPEPSMIDPRILREGLNGPLDQGFGFLRDDGDRRPSDVSEVPSRGRVLKRVSTARSAVRKVASRRRTVPRLSAAFRPSDVVSYPKVRANAAQVRIMLRMNRERVAKRRGGVFRST